MINLEQSLIIQPNQIHSFLVDIIGENVDIAYQNIFLKGEDTFLFVNETLSLIAKIIANAEKSIEYAKYHEAIEDYHKYLEEIRELFTKLKFNDELEKIILLKELIKMGFFSFNGHFTYRVVKAYKLKMFQGIYIVAGKGCCRNYASFYYDLFKDNMPYPIILGGSLSSNNSDNNKTTHVINLINYHDRLIGYDINNELIFTFTDRHQLMSISTPQFTMKYHSYWDLFHTNYDFEDIQSNLGLFEGNVGSIVPLDDINKASGNVARIIDSNLELFYKFHEHTHQTRDGIKEKIIQIK